MTEQIGTERPAVPVTPPTAAQRLETIRRAIRARQDRAILLGGEKIVVQFRAPETAASTEGDTPPPTREVTVRLVRAREYGEFLAKQSDEVALLQLCCDLAPEEVDRLAPESHAALVEAALELNFRWAIAWAERQLAVAERSGGALETAGAASPAGARA